MDTGDSTPPGRFLAALIAALLLIAAVVLLKAAAAGAPVRNNYFRFQQDSATF